MRRLGLWSLVFGLWVGPRIASACVCAAETRTAPADGEGAVPTNAMILVENGRMVELRDPAGVAVPLAAEQVWTVGPRWMWRFTPMTPLAPDTSYTLVDAEQGTQLAWFQTGGGPDMTAPSPPDVGAVTASSAPLRWMRGRRTRRSTRRLGRIRRAGPLTAPSEAGQEGLRPSALARMTSNS